MTSYAPGPVTPSRGLFVASAYHLAKICRVCGVVDHSEGVVKEELYDGFGRQALDSNPYVCVPLGFAGGLHDWDTGLVRFGWRDYDPDTGRWTAPDPIGARGGDPDWYGYCLDDPINGVDPEGLRPTREAAQHKPWSESFPGISTNPYLSPPVINAADRAKPTVAGKSVSKQQEQEKSWVDTLPGLYKGYLREDEKTALEDEMREKLTFITAFTDAPSSIVTPIQSIKETRDRKRSWENVAQEGGEWEKKPAKQARDNVTYMGTLLDVLGESIYKK